jgi:hypothetical protein
MVPGWVLLGNTGSKSANARMGAPAKGRMDVKRICHEMAKQVNAYGLKPWAILCCHFMPERFTPYIANHSVRRSIENPLHEKPDLCFVFSCVFCAFLRLF